jgi:N-acetylglucosaminyl-diphospho-decaprenol L-rhamnosyltransferase
MTQGADGVVPRLSIVVLSWNTRELLAACLQSLVDLGDDEPSFEVIVVDNDSADDSADMVAERFPDLRLIRNGQNDGYAIGNNIGAREATGEYLLLLNSDTEVRPGTLAKLVGFLDEHPGHGACAPRLVHPDDTVQTACMRFPTRRTAVFFDTVFDRWFPGNRVIPYYFMRDFDHLTSRDVDQPPGAAFLIRRPLWEALGGFDPELWLFFNDVDLCRRVHVAGHAIAYVAEAEILHHEGKSTSQFPSFATIWHKNRMAYYRKTFGWTGTLVARLATSLRGWEEARKLKAAGCGKEETAEVWKSVREIWKS